MEQDLRETLADLEHRQWAHWTRYFLEQMGKKFGQEQVMQDADVQRWLRQCDTAYADLTEEEKEKDRVWANYVLASVVNARLALMGRQATLQAAGLALPEGHEVCVTCGRGLVWANPESLLPVLVCPNCQLRRVRDLEREVAALRAVPLVIESYLLNADPREPIKLQRTPGMGGVVRWAIRNVWEECLNTAGAWEYEVNPSDRDDAFLARCRFATPAQALKAWLAAGYTLPSSEEGSGDA